MARNKDDWPALYERVQAADILVLGSPIWLGEKSSVSTRVIERLYGNSSTLNEQGQYAYYGKVGGCLITGNEDGIKHCSMNILYSLQHLGYTIPPQADAGWIGEAGPGPSYLDAGSGGPENDFTNRNTTFMTWNLLHTARLLKDAGGIPAHGNQRSLWDAGCRFDFPIPTTVDADAALQLGDLRQLLQGASAAGAARPLIREFEIEKLGLVTVKGRVPGFSGTIEGGESPSITGSVDASTITTFDETRDGHVQAPDFFDTERYPELRFESTAVATTVTGWSSKATSPSRTSPSPSSSRAASSEPASTRTGTTESASSSQARSTAPSSG